MLPLKRVRELAGSRQTYLQGVAAYNAGQIIRIERRRHAFYAAALYAVVREKSGAAQTAEIGLDAADEPLFARCSCGTYHRGGAFCRHLTAVLVYKYYADMLGGIPLAADRRPTASDPSAAEMLNAYLTPPETPPAPGMIGLIPTVFTDGSRLALRFALQNGKRHMLRDLGAFCAAVKTRATVDYSSELRLTHDPAQFSEECRPVLAFLMRHYDERQTVLAASGLSAAEHPLRELPLSDAAWEEFFALFSDRPLTVETPEGSGSRMTVDGDPCPAVSAAPSENGWLFTGGAFLLPTSCLYVLTGDSLYRCSADFSADAGPFLRALHTGGGRLFLSETDLPLFCRTVLVHLARRIRQDGEWPDPAAYPLPQGQAVVYLDLPAKNRLTARVEWRYDGGTVDPYGQDIPDIPRDLLAEQQLDLLLRPYFSADPAESGCLIFCGDDDRLFAFFEEGLPALSAHAQVMISDRLRRIRPASPPPVAITLSTGERLLDLQWSMTDTKPEELAALLRQYRQKRRYTRLQDGRFLRLTDAQLAVFAELTAGLALSDRELLRGHITLPPIRALYLDELAAQHPTLSYASDAAFRRMADRLRPENAPQPDAPAALQTALRPYQLTGFRWLRRLENADCGGILADEMGLGKTVQIIALLLDAKARGETLPALVICPTSLVLNWEHELNTFAPTLRVLALLGGAEQRRQLLAAADADVIVTSYDTVKRDAALYAGRRFAYEILDEAQYIKNPRTQNAVAAKAICADHRFALTGTPIENRISELWSLFDFLMPGFLFSLSRFRAQFELPILRDGDETAREQLRRLIAPFVLRRRKQEVLRELPPKTDQVRMIPLGDEQKKLYDAELFRARQQLALPGTGRMVILALLMRLRRLCCDPALCYENYRGDSAKIADFSELVAQSVENGRKMLVFSQFTSLLDRLETVLTAQSIRYYRLDGTTPAEQRAAETAAFNADDTPVYLISLRAGGTGLNLTGADTVVHFDPWWNLAVQEQATDRAHRIGQLRPVFVIRLIAEGTVEERILHMQQQKQALADTLLPEGGELAALTDEELRRLLLAD